MKKIILSILSCAILWNCNSGKKSKEEVTKNVTQENQMLYVWSLNAILNSENGASDFIYGGEEDGHPYKNDYQQALKEWWDINNRFDCKTSVEKLISGNMHNEAFVADFDGFFELPQAEAEQIIADETEYKDLYQHLWDNRENLKSKGIIAWDLIRAAGIIAWGRNAEYFTKEQAYELNLQVGKAVQKHFSSYEDMVANYLAGYFYWSNDKSKYEKRQKIATQLLNNKDSAWNVFPFDYDMTKKTK